jgi:hypothetical protein
MVKSGWFDQNFAREIRDVVTLSINTLDPIRLINLGVNDDKYSGEISHIVSRLAIRQDRPSLEEIQELIYSIFVKSFDAEMAGPMEKYGHAA